MIKAIDRKQYSAAVILCNRQRKQFCVPQRFSHGTCLPGSTYLSSCVFNNGGERCQFLKCIASNPLSQFRFQSVSQPKVFWWIAGRADLWPQPQKATVSKGHRVKCSHIPQLLEICGSPAAALQRLASLAIPQDQRTSHKNRYWHRSAGGISSEARSWTKNKILQSTKKRSNFSTQI